MPARFLIDQEGGVGMATPLSPAIHLGADRVVAGLGASPQPGADFLSYLAFDSSYTRPLIEIGRRDALEQKDEIEAFFSLRAETSTPASGLDRPAVAVA
jgi:hypothetical protein